MQGSASSLSGRKIGFIGGGNMAGALIRGLLSSHVVEPAAIRASDVNESRRDELHAKYAIEATDDNEAVAAWADVIVIAVKPQIVDRILAPIGAGVREGDLVVSIAAGVPIEALEARLPPGTRVIRTMPNTAAIALAGATAIAPGAHAQKADVEIAKALFSA